MPQTPRPRSLARHGRSLLGVLAGDRRDWAVTLPRPWRDGASLGSLGPLLVVASCVVWWFAYTGEGPTVAVGLFAGTVAIVLMTWSFVLAVRPRWFEPFFGGLDRMYAVHRWTGVLSMGAMLLHVRLEPEVEGGFRGVLATFEDAATEAAEGAELAFYVLVAISLVRWVPYRWWRLSHKLLGVPFVFAAFHTITVDKPFPPDSAWSVALVSICVIGVVAWLWRVIGRDALRPGLPYRVVSTEVHGRTIELELSALGRPLRRRAGQFAFVKLQLPGLREPHPFTVASAPDEDHLRFFIRDLGDWTARLQQRDLVGALVRVEGPYGRFEPLPTQGSDRPSDRTIVWVAGGVGITPFLSVVSTLPAGAHRRQRPLLLYCVHRAEDAMAIEVLQRAAAEDRIDLEVVASAEGRRLDPALLSELIGGDLTGAYVAVCGPAGLVATVERTSKQLGAEQVESEDFDIRSGVGPDLSRDIAAWTHVARAGGLRDRLRSS